MIGTIGSSKERFRGRDWNELSHVFPAKRGLVLFAKNSADQQECTQNHWASSQIKDWFESFQGIVHKTCIWREKETYISFENRPKAFPGEKKKRYQVFCEHSSQVKFSILVMQFQDLNYIWETFQFLQGLKVGLLCSQKCFSNPAVKLSLHEIRSQRRRPRKKTVKYYHNYL